MRYEPDHAAQERIEPRGQSANANNTKAAPEVSPETSNAQFIARLLIPHRPTQRRHQTYQQCVATGHAESPSHPSRVAGIRAWLQGQGYHGCRVCLTPWVLARGVTTTSREAPDRSSCCSPPVVVP